VRAVVAGTVWALRQAVNQTKTLYRTRNWKEYNPALVQRGSLTLWIDTDVANAWRAEKTGKFCKQKVYADLAIEAVLMVGKVFRQPLRQTQGLVRSLLALMGLDLPVPDYSTLCRRRRNLTVVIDPKLGSEPIHFLIDSSGLKVMGEGEWKVRKWGKEKRRKWIKLHLGMDARTGQITAARVTEPSADDGSQLPDLLAATPGRIDKAGGDGAYDYVNNFRVIAERGAEPIIPARLGAVLRKEPEAKARNAVVSRMEALWDEATGDARWKQESDYHRRSLSESLFSRWKRVLGPEVRARDVASQEVDSVIGCRILNRMLSLCRPVSEAVLVPVAPV